MIYRSNCAPSILLPILLLIAFTSCQNETETTGQSEEDLLTQPIGSQDWLTGNLEEKLETITNHLRGFDMAMVETGYRHVELYWAGQDENWGYADYQVEKLKLAIERGLERRPARAESAQQYLEQALPEMEDAVNERDKELFNQTFEAFTRSCNACHHAEQVPHFNVQIPENRITGIRMP
ncbi:MAG: hypothetical protein JJU46_13660 [Balneolaceae bacterium]|nr:hypothetical protein [Balneolaceae bacterium]MCH8550067.1 hypothetical protein [Balneolaceae bacterium]